MLYFLNDRMYDAFQELEDISNNLMKAKMSSFRKDESHSPTDRELRFQQLQQRLNKVNGNIYIYSPIKRC